MELSQRTRDFWRSGLIAASRTALACIIVGCMTLYGPTAFKKQVAFPAFSYVAMILIVTNATLGDTIRGLWFAFYCTLQTVCPAMLCLWYMGPTRLTAVSTSLVLGIAAFFIALPKSTHVVAKRVALGQLVIIYVVGYITADEIDAIMHPVKENSKLFAENASERLRLFVQAFCAKDNESSQAFISQPNTWLESMQWEKFLIKFLRPYCKNPGDRLQELETPLRGMEIALNNKHIPVSILDEQLKGGIDNIEGEISQNLYQLRSHMPCETPTVPESTQGEVMNFLEKLETIPTNDKDLPSYFFIFCMKLFHIQSRAMTIPPNSQKVDKKALQKKQDQQQKKTSEHQNGLSLSGVLGHWPTSTLGKERLVSALNCSLSLGFAVLFGLYYSKPNGFWSGLPVAVSFAAAREATFKVANVKFQGTVIGNVYGVLGCFIFQSIVQIRFIALLPCFIFTSFLQQSKMYGQAGAVSAVIGAILILGRRNFGPPTDFAIARIVETFIGLSCSIMVDLLLNPTRAASLAKVQLCKTFGTLQDSLSSIEFTELSKDELMKSAKNIKENIIQLDKFVTEADAEPNFWFLPFNTACYKRLMSSFTKIGDLLHFTAHAISLLDEQIQRLDVNGVRDELDKINGDLELVGNLTATSMKSFQEVASIKSLLVLEKDLENSGKTFDLELGKSANFPLMNLDEKELGKIISSFLEHLQEAMEKIEFPDEEEKEIKSQIVISFSALGFCLKCLMKETKEVEKAIKELVQWENPTSHINLHELSCKIHALYD
ncbi:p-hydroxybenzoic acid efflux pump subunit AaeB [Bienertia sinuspersici]